MAGEFLDSLNNLDQETMRRLVIQLTGTVMTHPDFTDKGPDDVISLHLQKVQEVENQINETEGR